MCTEALPTTGFLEFSFFFYNIYLLFRERERNIDVRWLPLARTRIGAESASHACILTRNRTRELSLWGRMLNHLSHASQGSWNFLGTWDLANNNK